MPVTQYEKEEYTIEAEFEYTVYDKVPHQVTIDEPYVIEHPRTYTASVPVPYEVATVEEQVTYELEEYTVEKQVPFIVEQSVTVVEVHQEPYLVEKEDRPSHVSHQERAVTPVEEGPESSESDSENIPESDSEDIPEGYIEFEGSPEDSVDMLVPRGVVQVGEPPAMRRPHIDWEEVLARYRVIDLP